MTAQPIAPERWDTGPIAVDDDANAAAARAFRANALASGHAVAAEDGVTILRPRKTKGRTPPPLELVADEQDAPESVREPLPAYLELDAGEPGHTIVVKRRNAPPLKLRPLITFGSARKNGWYQMQINRLEQEGNACTDEAQLDGIIAEISRYQHAMMRLTIPDLPDDILDDLSPAQWAGLMAAMNRISEEVQQESVRTVERITGKPIGLA